MLLQVPCILHCIEEAKNYSPADLFFYPLKTGTASQELLEPGEVSVHHANRLAKLTLNFCYH